MYGGEPEIRTLGGITLVGFQDRCNRPLCQLPVEFKVYFFSKAGGGTRIRTGDQSFAGSCLTAWLCRQPVVPGAGLEPAQCYHRGILSPLRLPISPSGQRTQKNTPAQTSAPDISTGVMERETRFELATPTLARLCSTTELFPHCFCGLEV